MNYKRYVNFISGFVSLIAVIVMLGWFFDIGIFKSILPQWPTMKFVTAFCFLLSGIKLYFVSQIMQKKEDYSLLIVSIISFTIALIMGILLVSSFFGIRTGLEDLFVKEGGNAVLTVTPGKPSIPTIVAFLLIVISGMIEITDRTVSRKVLDKEGWILIGIGVLACIGYITHIPVLFYSWEGFSSAMALHTAILFVILGGGKIWVVKVR